MPIHQDQFWGSNTKVCVTYSINSKIAIIISDSQQKYVVLIALRRSGGVSKILFRKNNYEINWQEIEKLDLDNSGSLSVDEFMSLPELQQNPLVQRVIGNYYY